ncbi:MAG: 6-carboxytetrahydropterin synthase QueD [Candidatus Dadabacteria bacterium]|nr:6-carboxytetrahydropterin synthase QueD [Candidatus Dadabacteria bacterium]
MFEVSVKSSFSAAHALTEIGGKCENLHGHNFAVEVSVTSERLNKQGVVVDFRALKSYLGEILGVLDHTFLNETAPFAGRSPTSELLARYIHDEMKERIINGGIDGKVRVNVWESETSRASYWEEQQ